MGQGSIADVSGLGSQACFMVLGSQDCNSDLLARLASSLVKNRDQLLY